VIWYRRAVFVFCGLFVLIGVTLLVATGLRGGGALGFLLGGLFIALGVARATFERQRGGGR